MKRTSTKKISMPNVFGDFDPSNFWANGDEDYIGRPATQDMIQKVERKTGRKLPSSYIELIMSQNGGTPTNTAFRTTEATSWAEDHIAINGILGVDDSRPYSIDNDLWVDEWGYPDLGIYIYDCPSGGHDIVCLDYRKCGPSDEPEVVHIDQELDYKVTRLADNFESFVRGLVHEDEVE